jgi:hypothetical protein
MNRYIIIAKINIYKINIKFNIYNQINLYFLMYKNFKNLIIYIYLNNNK